MTGLWVSDSCQLCGSFRQLEQHHIFGASNRKKSSRYGYVITLCHNCHNEPGGIHSNRANSNELKRMAQTEFEKTHSREEFISEFGRNYLMED
jgi:5-methylcytosine-specific restriction endonuclease McrA